MSAGRLKLLTARLLVSPPAARVLDVVNRGRVRSHDLVFDTRHPAVTPEVRAQLFWRIYEGAEIRFARAHLSKTPAIVDLGSSLGFTAAHSLRHLSPDGLIVAVEANPRLVEPLTATLTAHAGGARVEVVHAAVDYSGSATVSLAVGATSVDSLVEAGLGGVRVPTIRLRDIVTQFDLQEFTLLSDIEGAEAELLRHDGAALRLCSQAVIELHDTSTATVDLMLEQLRGLGLAPVARSGNVVALHRKDTVG